jgi:GH35 family endo-1,4-beta-xylanase
MQRKIKICLLLVTVLLPATSFAQLSTNPDKFLGNITTRGTVEAGGGVPNFYELWNQITCENESKWASVEGTRGTYNWNGADNAFNYAKKHDFTYKFHALVWGSQYPGWIEDLSYTDRYQAITEWYDAAHSKYPNLPMIDVVNEAVEGHQKGTHFMKEALGGGGKTGYDWLIKAFEMAYERWPNTILIYNDFNTFQWNTDQYIDLVRTLRDAGAPVDAYGCQSHDLGGVNQTNFKNVMKKIQDALKMPMYITEYDIGDSNDSNQKWNYQQQFPVMWEADYCAGVTLWGYVYGATWTTDGNSGLYKDGKERSAMTWLKEYMATDAAKNAVSPYPGMKKEASIYIRPAALKVARGDVLPIYVRASMATKTIEKIDLYIDDELIATLTEAPYRTEYNVPTSAKSGAKVIKAVVTTTDGSTYERLSRFSTLASTKKRAPFGETLPQLPGTINISEYDEGAQSVTYYNASRDNVSTKDGQWMDYTVEVAEDGIYSFDAEIASAKDGGMFHLAEYGEENLDILTEFVDVPKTGSSSDFKLLHGKLIVPLTAGRHVFTLLVDKGGFYIKNITFNRYEEGEGTCLVKAFGKEYGVGDYVPVEVRATAKNSTVRDVKVYANNLYVGTATESPYKVEFVPSEMGTYAITAIVTSVEGKEKWSKVRELKVTSPTPTAIRTVNVDTNNTDAPTYNLMGVPVSEDYRGIVIKNGKKVWKK